VRAYLQYRRKKRVMLGGHNVSFDVRFLRAFLPDYHELVLGGVVDTKPVAQALAHAGLLPKTLGTGLEALARHFGIPHRPHDALEDANATALVYARMLTLLRGVPATP
jgi:DNA polymerase-3 subunit epsilon/ribonuclease T